MLTERKVHRLYNKAADAYHAGIVEQSGGRPACSGYGPALAIAFVAGKEATKAGTLSYARRLPLDVWQAVLAEALWQWEF